MSDFRKSFVKKILSLGKFFPPFFYLLVLVNAYVWEGKEKNLLTLAPMRSWGRRVIFPLVVSFFTAFAFFWFFSERFYLDSVEYVKSAYPSILGFVIGLFALAVTSRAYEDVAKKSVAKAKMISIDLAYPLFIIFVTMVLSFLYNPCGFLGRVWHLAFIVYSTFLIFDVIAAVYMLSRSGVDALNEK
ncbi:hypothetical protein [Billgrantia saliphila]|uniref:hypothetical protein n=1 Tax=Billgrantia saliphila TaxID=1848458 RepID=UPI0012DBDE0C|nr:hypothetical protein [Halomonas saliphila]